MINTQENQVTKIYLVTNCYGDPNKVYIGKTRNEIIRFNKHKNTYGKQIIIKIIDKVNSLDKNDWKPLECKWIQHYINLEYDVQNIQKKGGSGVGKCTDEHKLRISQANKGRPKPEGFGEKLRKIQLTLNYHKDPERGRKISQSNKGKKHSEEACLKKSQANKGRPKPKGFGEKLQNIARKPINQFNKNGDFIKEWLGAKQAGVNLFINASDITQCCLGKKKSAGGYIWSYKKAK